MSIFNKIFTILKRRKIKKTRNLHTLVLGSMNSARMRHTDEKEGSNIPDDPLISKENQKSNNE